MGKNNLGNIGNARTAEQQAHMEKTVGQGKCPFCVGDGFDSSLNKIVIEGTYWRAWVNPFSYPHHSIHITVATRGHTEKIQDITPDAWREWGQINQYLIAKYDPPGGGIVMRFGDNRYNGGTLNHVHSHIQVPDQKGMAIAVFFKDAALTRFLIEQNPKRQ